MIKIFLGLILSITVIAVGIYLGFGHDLKIQLATNTIFSESKSFLKTQENYQDKTFEFNRESIISISLNGITRTKFFVSIKETNQILAVHWVSEYDWKHLRLVRIEDAKNGDVIWNHLQ